LLDSDDLILCDIRDREAVLAEFTAAKPDVVFHAAALKHVTFLERYPDEAYKTNVSGTLNVLQAACEVGTEVVVNISSDKAADPKNTLGITKRIGERLTTYFSQEHDADFMSVRFGNVLGSKGSVVPTFHQQIINDEPITITDPEVTRFFMTIEEACQLVVQAGAIGGNGDVLVLDMGEPVKIIDLALHLQAQLRPGTPANFVFTGLRAGEKLHEVLAGPDEELVSQPHELIARYSVPPLDPANVDQPGANSDIVGTSHLPTSP
jgi:dTDP-glucose 4,6-dehydratase